VAQADFGRNLKPAPAAKLLVFSDFLLALAFRKVLFRFLHVKSTPCGTKSTSSVAFQGPVHAATKVDFGFQVASQSRLRFLSRILKSALPASKVDFGRNSSLL
jgi:hypothetical protein